MRHDNDLQTIETRAAAIGQSIGQLAVSAGIGRSTPYRWARGVSPNLRTLKLILEELEKQERSVKAHLDELHGQARNGAAE
jgi:hypothetical protein